MAFTTDPDWRSLPRKHPTKKRSKMFALRVTPSEYKEIRKIAKKAKKTAADILIEGVLGPRVV